MEAVTKTRKTYQGMIEKLEPNQIFVFGSNTEGKHGAGAALWARINAGAIYGQPYGFHGDTFGACYSIVTKDLNIKEQPSIPEEHIVNQIKWLYAIAKTIPYKEFIIAYSGTRPNLNGYSNLEMAKMFKQAGVDMSPRGIDTSSRIPDNIIFEQKFWELIQIV